jgi:hypothetical protein
MMTVCHPWIEFLREVAQFGTAASQPWNAEMEAAMFTGWI